jgi:folate-binding protein YgfZ
MSERSVLRLSGSDTHKFLNDLVTNDLSGMTDGLVYAALLTPQGKYLFDFFLIADGDAVLVDVAKSRAPALAQRLTMYKLRADVTVADSGLYVHRGLGDMPEGAFQDPRHEALGWRSYFDTPQEDTSVDWDAIRVEHCIPEAEAELIADGSYILESGFERLNGVDFRKGCYVGQEVTARMKHKTELRKGLVSVAVEGTASVGTEILADGKAAGTLFTQSGGKGIAYLRFDRAKGEMTAGEASVTRLD